MSEFLSVLTPVKSLAEGNEYFLATSLKYRSDILSEYGIFPNGIVEVPARTFHTDLASIPKFFQWLWKPDGPWRKSAVIHDYLCRKRADLPMSRKMCDDVFLEAMRIDGIDLFTRTVFYSYVRLYGILSGRAE